MNEYLSRINVEESGIAADLKTLKMLQRQHLLNVPFENLDIHWRRPIILETDRFYKKIVDDRRGGFCYELNGLFNQLLRHIGFRTRIVSARVFAGERGLGPEFDHAAIIVTIGELEYLADVGFGDFAAEPLRLVPDLEQPDREGTFVIRRGEYANLEVAKRRDDGWQPQYIFSLFGRDLTEFAGMCDYQQYSPDSHFTQGKICSLMTADGRKTLTDTKFVVTSNRERTETAVGSEPDFYRLLSREFNIEEPK